MEKPAEPKTLINPFPPHKRRHLKSQTFSTFIHFLSHSYCPKTGGNNNELGSTNEVHAETEGAISTEGEMLSFSGNASCKEIVNVVEPVNEDRMETIEVDLGNRINKELVLETGRASNELEQITDGTANMESGVLSTNGDPSCLNITKVAESVHEDTMETEEFDLGYRMNKELCKETDFEIMDSLKKTKPGTSVVSLATIGGEPQNSLVGSLLEDSEIVTQVDADKEDHSCKLIEGSLFLDMDETVHSSKPGGNKEVRKDSVVESIELQQMDLDNSLSKCGLMDSPLCVAIAEEIEEGEISGDFLIDDELIDFVCEEEQTSELIASREEVANRVQTRTGEVENKYHMDIGETVDEVNRGVEMNIREKNVALTTKKVVFESVGTKLAHGYEIFLEVANNQKQTDRKGEEFNPSAVTGKVLAKMATLDQGDLSADKDAGVQKKRKRTPATQEKKAKKKKKQRQKRAENNRKNGVKRLKLQPMKPKPKPIEYCRHYLMGRCQEGDKCKFSHDTTPLTKSKPCCHFARNSCMKGDDCPYDHQLSKYPCSNFVTKGYCGRGPDCFFSHEKVQRSEGSPKSINVPSSDVKGSSLSSVMNHEKTKSSYNLTQKVDPKPGFGGISSSKSAEQKVVENRHRAATPEPTGMGKLLFEKSPLGHENKFNQTRTSSKTNCDVNISLPLVYTRRNMASNPNGTSKVTGHVQPKGVSFLSFGNSPTRMEIDKQAAFPSKQAESLKLTNHADQSNKGLLSNLSEVLKTAPSQLPRGINFLSFGKATFNNSGNITIPIPNADSGEYLSNLNGTSKVTGRVEPKGLSFLSSGKSPTRDTSMEIDKQSAFPSKQAESLKPTNHAAESKKDMLPNLGEMPKTAPSQLPRGRNFFSFGKATLSNSGNIAISTPNADSGESSSNSNGTSKVTGHVEPKRASFLSSGKSPTSDTHMEIDKQAAFPSKQAESLRLANHVGESKKDLLPNLGEVPKTGPSQLPRGRNFLSFGKATLSNSGNITISTTNADSGESSSAHERERIPNLRDQPGRSTPSSVLKAILSSGSSSSQKALQSTLAFAAKYDSRIKINHPQGRI